MTQLLNDEVQNLIERLQRNEIAVSQIPQDYKNDPQIVTFERKNGLRVTKRRGFDIISNMFFVEEELIYRTMYRSENGEQLEFSFDTFDAYFDFLCGDIYENACYMFYPDLDKLIIENKLDAAKILEKTSLISYCIDDYTLMLPSAKSE